MSAQPERVATDAPVPLKETTAGGILGRAIRLPEWHAVSGLTPADFDEPAYAQAWAWLGRQCTDGRLIASADENAICALLAADCPQLFERLGGFVGIGALWDLGLRIEPHHAVTVLLFEGEQRKAQAARRWVDKGNLADYVHERRVSLERLEAALAGRSAIAAPPVAYVDLDAPDPIAEEIPWIVRDWIGEQEIVLVCGRPKCGKSTGLYGLALCSSAGLEWLGFGVTRAVRVLFVQEDEPRHLPRRRLQRLARGMSAALQIEIAPWRKDRLRVAAGQGIRLDTPQGRARLEREIAAYRPDLVVVDSVSKAFRGIDGNDNAAVADALAELSILRSKYAVAFVLAHHVGKAGFGVTDPSERLRLVRGAGEWTAAVDGIVWVEPQASGVEWSVLERRERDDDSALPAVVVHQRTEASAVFLDRSQPAATPRPSVRDLARLAMLDWLVRSGQGARKDVLDNVARRAAEANPEQCKKERTEMAKEGLIREESSGFWVVTDKGCREAR